MCDIIFVYKGTPFSYNSSNKYRRARYERSVLNSFMKKYTSPLPSGSELYGYVYYFHNSDENMPDADNISKPLWDALSNIAFDDDRDIIIRSAFALDLRKNDAIEINIGDLPEDIGIELAEILSEPNSDAMLVEVGTINNKEKLFKASSLWK